MLNLGRMLFTLSYVFVSLGRAARRFPQKHNKIERLKLLTISQCNFTSLLQNRNTALRVFSRRINTPKLLRCYASSRANMQVRPRNRTWVYTVVNVALNSLHTLLWIHIFLDHVILIAPTIGPSMLPTLHVTQDAVAVLRVAGYQRGKGVQVGDLVCVRMPYSSSGLVVKRIIGMPGDFVVVPVLDESDISPSNEELEDMLVNKQYHDSSSTTHNNSGLGIESINITSERHTRMAQVPVGHCYIAGDNLPWSRDSRSYGPVPLALITGKVLARVWPISRWGILKSGLVEPN